MLPQMRKLEPVKNCLTWLLLIELKMYEEPKCWWSIISHVVLWSRLLSTQCHLFGKVFALCPMREMCLFTKEVSVLFCVEFHFPTFHFIIMQPRNIYCVYMHVPHVAFVKISMVHNSWTYLRFIEPSECRIGRQVIHYYVCCNWRMPSVGLSIATFSLKLKKSTSLHTLWNMILLGFSLCCLSGLVLSFVLASSCRHENWRVWQDQIIFASLIAFGMLGKTVCWRCGMPLVVLFTAGIHEINGHT
jgi:hypothetical protein